MSNLPNSKQLDLGNMFKDTSRYLDILTIDNPEFEKKNTCISNISNRDAVK